MSLSEADLHKDLLESCTDGDLKRLLELAYYQSELVQSLINDDIPCLYDDRFPGQYQPGEYIHAAAMTGHHEIVAQLINLGAEPNSTSTRYGTPLEIACRNGALDIIRLLHLHGIDLHPDTFDIWNSPIYIACESNHTDIIQYILSVKSDILTHKTEGFIDGCILLSLACRNQNIQAAKLLIEKGVDINAIVRLKDGAMTIPLEESCRNESAEVIQYLLQQHVEVSGATIEKYPTILATYFNKMKSKFKPSVSIRRRKEGSEPYFITYQWSDKNLATIHKSWLTQNHENIHSIELYHNKISELPEDFFIFLPNLEDLDLSMNCLTKLPGQGLDTSKITKLSAPRNRLQSCPLTLFKNKFIQIIDLSQNRLKVLPSHEECENCKESLCNEAQWTCNNLITLKLSNNQITDVPWDIHGATKLERLNLSNNELTSFVSPWNCPMDDLDLSENWLTSFEHNVEAFWTMSMRRLNLSKNKIACISWSICHLEKLCSLDMSYNRLESLPPQHYWNATSLSKLNLSHNRLSASCGPEGFADIAKSSIEVAMLAGKEPQFLSNCELPVECFRNCLQALDLSFNDLEMVPDTTCSLSSLGELILSNNPRIQRLPPELGKLRNIWNLRLENLNIQDIPEDVKSSRSTKKILAHLRGKLRKSVPFKRMKLMVVGLQGRGKTTLLAMLQGKRLSSDNIATVGISVEQWTLQAPSNRSKIASFFSTHSQSDQDIIFSTWDLAGQHVYYSTHQCFLTSNTLYLVLWNVGHGQEGIEGLAPWLLNIQARAPKSEVIIVGTHLDKLPQGKRKERLAKLRNDIYTKFLKKGFPKISGNVFVSNTTGEGLQMLKEVIYKVTSNMQDSNLLEPMIGKKVPSSYVQLYDAVREESQQRALSNEPPILTAEQFLQLARENPDNDILDIEELDHAAKFLHDYGILLHFNDQIRGLNDLYFIDPTWLCDMIALLVTVKEKNPFIKNGYIKNSDVFSVLKSPRLPLEFIPQFLQIMERFEIALKLDDEKILIPSMLPREKPFDALDQAAHTASVTSSGNKNRLSKFVSLPRNQLITQNGGFIEYIIRNYLLSYVPAGFWSRLIARLIMAVHKWGMLFMEQETDADNNVKDSVPNPIIGATTTTNYTMIYWREGIFVSYDAGRFLIESFKDDIDEVHSSEGLSITVWSDFGDFSVMGFIVDQIDRLISEWYPGLEDLDEFGSMIVERMIPCPACITSFRQHQLSKYVEDKSKVMDILHYFRNPQFVNQFSLAICALAAVSHENIQCAKHADTPVALLTLVPDLLLTDLPPSMLLAKNQLDFNPSDTNRLGGGGAGEVFKASYKGEVVAVKRFHSTRQSRNFEGEFSSECKRRSADEATVRKLATFIPAEQTICDQLEDNKVVRVFWELRQEVAVLCRLQNPFIIGFLGVCRVPLCFALELAPEGGLFSILDDHSHKRDLMIQSSLDPPVMESILGRKLTYKIALQVAHALLYLHESEIVYRDLKSDNVLVWSLNENDLINIKLSDYGISCFATPQGVLGEGGTPGFQAPEVKTGCAYDEKVDIFSYGIWLYELITGYRPFREHRTSAEIRKAVNNGIRPSLKHSNVESKLPYLEMLMQDCWLSSPASRPSAFEVTKRMEDPRFFFLCNSFPKVDEEILEHITFVFPMGLNQNLLSPQHNEHTSLSSENKLLIWCGDGKTRKFVIMKSENGQIQTDISCPGSRVLCAAKVGERIWLGNEGCQIEVFGYHHWQIPRILWSFTTRDAITDLLVEDKKCIEEERVFASLANGTVLVFKRKASQANKKHDILKRVESQEESDRMMKMEKNEWDEPTIINLANEGRPAKSLVFTKDGRELWVGSGNCIAIINVSNLQLIQQIKVFTLHRHMINQLVTDGRQLWSIDRKSTVIYQWDVETRQKTFRFDCDVTHDVTGVVIAQPVTDKLFHDLNDSPPLSPKTSQKSLHRITEETLQMDNNKEPSLPDENKLNASNKEKEQIEENPSTMNLLGSRTAKNIRKIQPSFMFQRKNRKPRSRQRSNQSDGSFKVRPRSGAITDSSMRLSCMVLVGDTLWVGRSVGDVLVINVREPTDNSTLNTANYSGPKSTESFVFGEVLSQFSDEAIKQFGLPRGVSLLMKMGSDQVIAVFRTEMEALRKRADSYAEVELRSRSRHHIDQFRFLILSAWGCEDFKKFTAGIHNLHNLEENY